MPETRFRLGEVECGIVSLLRFGEGRCVECDAIRRAKHCGNALLCDSHTAGIEPWEAEQTRRKAQRQVESALEALGRVVTAVDHRRHVGASREQRL